MMRLPLATNFGWPPPFLHLCYCPSLLWYNACPKCGTGFGTGGNLFAWHLCGLLKTSEVMVKMSMGKQALHQEIVWHVAEVCLDAFCFPVQGLRLLSRRAHDCQGPCWTVGVFSEPEIDRWWKSNQQKLWHTHCRIIVSVSSRVRCLFGLYPLIRDTTRINTPRTWDAY